MDSLEIIVPHKRNQMQKTTKYTIQLRYMFNIGKCTEMQGRLQVARPEKQGKWDYKQPEKS